MAGSESALEIASTTHHQFKDGEYLISMSVGKERVLKLEIEDESNGNKWLGKFEATYIEELTHKTGNFKQFNIFCSMLESAMKKTSESVMLDLMTYADLESLRSQKIHANHRKVTHNNSSQLNSKRYLIMTYTVEFDRIHYPLSLQYAGKSDKTILLREKIKHQQEEINELKNQISKMKLQENPERNDEFDQLLNEKEEMQLELEMCKGILSKTGVAKELRILKKVIESLESDLLKERSKYKRMHFKKNEEFKRLSQELEEVKASERNLKIRCKNQTEELSILKRVSPQLKMPIYVNRWQRAENGRRSVSQEKLPRNASIRSKTPSPSGSRRFNPTAYIEEKQRRQREAIQARGRSRYSVPHNNSGRRSRSNSYGRSTPDLSHVTQRPPSTSRRSSSARELYGPKLKRTSSVGSYGSRHSSFDSGSERNHSRDRKMKISPSSNKIRGSRSTSRKSSKKSIIRSTYSSGGSEYDDLERPVERSSRKQARRNSKRKLKSDDKVRNNNDDDDNDGGGNASLDIANIDARLNALQRFMKTNLDEY